MTLQHGADHCTESAFTGSWDHHHPYMVGMRGAVKVRGNIRRSWLLAFQDYYAAGASPLLQRWDPDISTAVLKLDIINNQTFALNTVVVPGSVLGFDYSCFKSQVEPFQELGL